MRRNISVDQKSTDGWFSLLDASWFVFIIYLSFLLKLTIFPLEIVLKAPYNEKVDVWSLGVTLLQIIDKRGFDIGNGFKVFATTFSRSFP